MPVGRYAINDREALVERLAADLWQSVAEGSPDGWPWKAAGYWQPIYRDLARRAVHNLTH